MKTVTKFFKITAIAALIVVGFAACGGNKGSSSSSSGGSSDAANASVGIKKQGRFMVLTEADGSSFKVPVALYEAQEKQIAFIAENVTKRKLMTGADQKKLNELVAARQKAIEENMEALKKLTEDMTQKEAITFLQKFEKFCDLSNIAKFIFQNESFLENYEKISRYGLAEGYGIVLRDYGDSIGWTLSWFPKIKFDFGPNMGLLIDEAEKELEEMKTKPMVRLMNSTQLLLERGYNIRELNILSALFPVSQLSGEEKEKAARIVSEYAEQEPLFNIYVSLVKYICYSLSSSSDDYNYDELMKADKGNVVKVLNLVKDNPIFIQQFQTTDSYKIDEYAKRRQRFLDLCKEFGVDFSFD